MYRITFKQSPNYWIGRNGYQPIALVNHRMVGYLPGTDATFLNAANQVSAHFGIGYRSDGGPVRISQYVDLSDSAWTAGNYDPSGGWPLIKKTSTGAIINPNYYIIGIEHEDGGPNDGRVSQPVLDASTWLQSILLTGNIELMRYVGITIREQSTASALASIIPYNETVIDHNRIAGVRKPYCWRPYKLDTGGFPAWQPILLAQLRGNEMAIQDTLDLLELQIAQLEQEKLEAETAAEAATAAATAANNKLSVAKTKAQEIKVLSDDIINL